MKQFTKLLAILCLSLSVFIIACKKDGPGTSTLNVRLTDAPAAYTAINIDIREVRVKLRDDSSSWTNLTTTANVYNLLNFQNGVDTLLATGIIPTGNVKEVRFILGPNNTVIDNGIVYPLKLSSQDESGLKIKVSKSISSSFETMVIDFDAAQSVIKENNGTYRLKPVLKLK